MPIPQEFIQKALTDKELQMKLLSLATLTPDKVMESVVSIAKEYGFEITADDVQAFVMMQMQMMQQQGQSIAGKTPEEIARTIADNCK